MKTLLIAILIFNVYTSTQAATSKARWCAIGDKEYQKCVAMKTAFAKKSLKPPVECIKVEVGNACLRKIERNEADLVRVSDTAMFAAGKMHKLVPIMHEDVTGQHAEKFGYKTVVVVKKNNKAINNINDLRGKKSCHTGVGRTAGWTAPVSFLNARSMLPIKDCDNNVKNVAGFFSQSCAPGAYTDYYNPDGNNPTNICKLCDKQSCPSNDKYSSYVGAFRCLVDGKGEVAFVKHSTVPYDARGKFQYDTFDYELLCPDGTRNPVKDFSDCSWVTRPTKGVVTRANADIDAYKRLLEKAATLFNSNTNSTFKLFESTKYGGKNLLFTDGTLDLADTGKKNTYLSYLGEGYANTFETIRPKTCRKNVRMCVIGVDEGNKCSDMTDAMAIGRITATFSSVIGKDRADCMNKIKNNQADIMTADDQETYVGGAYHQLVPIASEKYDQADTTGSSFWAVAVAPKSSNVTIKTLKGRKSCHTGINDSEGWSIPLGFLAKNKFMTINHCNIASSAANYFSGSCVPGAVTPKKLCSLCQGKCKRGGTFSGPKGAFRCLVEKNADVTFVRHNTVEQNTDGKNNETWAKNLKSSDFELLCIDGSRKPVTQWRTCNLGRVASRAILTHQSRNSDYKRHFSIVLGRAASRYGKTSDKSFKMFSSPYGPGKKDLIFRDDTVALGEIKNQDYQKWLGKDYVEYIQAVDSQRCRTNGAPSNMISFGTVNLIITALLMLFV